MASQMDVHIVSANVGALSNAKRPIFFIPDKGGGITVLGAHVSTSAVGTSNINLIDLGSTGASSAGTLFTGGSIVFAVNTPQALVLSTAFVEPGRYVGLEELNTGALGTVTIVSVEYVIGKAGG